MATLQDVAQEAGVSVSTVSRVMNQPDLVHPDTRDQVEDAIDTLDYSPSRVARRLRSKKKQTGLLGLVIPDIQNPFFADVSRGVEDVARANDYAVLFSNADEDPAKQKIAVDTLRTEDVSGVIVPPVSTDDPSVKRLLDADIPVVCVDRRLEDARVDTIVSDNENGAYRATKHLIDAGHRRIGFIGGIPHISTSEERLRGYKRALRDFDVPVETRLIREGDSRRESSEALTRDLMESERPPTGLVTGNNLTTLGALSVLNVEGYRIPEDVALVGYDDIPWAMALNPPPTVISQPGYEMGKRAAEVLLQRLDEPDRSSTVITLQPELIVRQSA